MNKLEITDVIICEWDADTKCIIVSPAEGWKVDVNYPISEAHASMVTMEKMDPDYSHLIGKWLRCTNHPCPIGPGSFKVGSWYEMNQNPYPRSISAIDDNGDPWFGLSPSCFDLTDARDYNPDEQTPGEEARDIALRNIEEAKKIKVERKPHQLQEYDAVECNSEERAEIIRVADECGFDLQYTVNEYAGSGFPNLGFEMDNISGFLSKQDCAGRVNWHSVPDFIAKIRGTYPENKVNVTEHKHPEIV